MVECMPNFSELSSAEKEELVVRLFAELQLLRGTVQALTNRVALLEAENKDLGDEVRELRGKLAKNSTIPSKPASISANSSGDFSDRSQDAIAVSIARRSSSDKAASQSVSTPATSRSRSTGSSGG